MVERIYEQETIPLVNDGTPVPENESIVESLGRVHFTYTDPYTFRQHRCGMNLRRVDTEFNPPEYTFVTAAHCFDPQEFPGYYTITAPGNNRYRFYRPDKVTLINNTDLAIVELRADLPEQVSAFVFDLPEDDLTIQPGDPVTIYGWGGEERDDEPIDSLNSGSMEVFYINDQPNFPVVSCGLLQEGEMCLLANPSAACNGDSGGPVTIEQNGQIILIGYIKSALECENRTVAIRNEPWHDEIELCATDPESHPDICTVIIEPDCSPTPTPYPDATPQPPVDYGEHAVFLPHVIFSHSCIGVSQKESIIPPQTDMPLTSASIGLGLAVLGSIVLHRICSTVRRQL